MLKKLIPDNAKLGLYDSGLGGLSVLRELLKSNLTANEIIYIGDSARAPYGDKSPEELKSYVYEIFDFMEKQGVNLVISACNTSSMYLHEMDLSKYSFKILSLFDIMQEYFVRNISEKQIALLATESNINSKRYLDWAANIHPVKCPKLVPLVEAGQLEQARAEFAAYTKQLPKTITKAIVGCTHYAFLASDDLGLEFIDPAKVLVDLLELNANSAKTVDTKIFCTGDESTFIKAVQLLNDECFNLDVISKIDLSASLVKS